MATNPTAPNVNALKQLFGAPQTVSIQSTSIAYQTALAEVNMLQAAQSGVISELIAAWLAARAEAQTQPSTVNPEVAAANLLQQALIDFTGVTPTSLPEVVNALAAWSQQYGTLPQGSQAPAPPSVPQNLLNYLGL